MSYKPASNGRIKDLYKRHHAMLHNKLFRIVRDPQLAEDFIQDAFASFMENNTRNGPIREAPFGWIHRKAIQLASNYARSNGRMRERSLADEELRINLVEKTNDGRLNALLETLPPEEIDVVDALYSNEEGNSFVALARSLDIPPSTLYDRRMRLGKKVRDHFDI
jgi:RNA polymerase sigma factor (sigma-70 family)